MSRAALEIAKLNREFARGGSIGRVDAETIGEVYFDATGTARTIGETSSTRVSNDYVIGNALDNTLNGGRGDDILNGGAGRDTLNGGDGFDTATYTNAASGLTINLLNSSQNTGDARGDIYNSIEDVVGSQHGDIITGNNVDNFLFGLSGDDTIEGGLGIDFLEGGNGNDTLIGEFGTGFLAGARSETMLGGNGFDIFLPGARAEDIDGGANDAGTNDMLSYGRSLAGVTVNLQTGRGQGGLAQGDTYIGIEGVEGSHFADTLIGSTRNEVFIGAGGDDHIRGNGGDDTFLFDITRGPGSGFPIEGSNGLPNIGNVTIEDMLPKDFAGDTQFDRLVFTGEGITGDVLRNEVSVVQNGANTVLTSDTLFEGSVTLLNFDAASLFFF